MRRAVLALCVSGFVAGACGSNGAKPGGPGAAGSGPGQAGATGQAGTTGTAGTTGQAGTTGAAGTTGQAGTTGAAGTAGAAGAGIGVAGTNGSAGTGGPDGSAGVDAAAGRDAGTTGTAGAGADAKPGDAPAGEVSHPGGDAGLPAKGLLAVYWGQNGWGATHNDKNTWEKPLGETCTSHPEYDLIILSFATQLAHTRNQPAGQSFVPELNFANHCEIPYDTQNQFLLRCDEIAAGVRTCQAAGKKVLISIGGATGSAGFQNDDDGKKAAQAVWDIFLGGNGSIRPFANAALDGVDLDIEGGGTTGYSAFVKALRPLMDQSGRKYYITSAPQCPFPDAFVGPAPGRVLGDAKSAFDYVFVQFYNNYCGYGTPSAFRESFAMWKTLAAGGPKILVGLPATVGAAGSGFVPRATLPSLINDVKADPAFGGVMLWDASNDQNSADGSGTTYGAYAKSLLK